MELSFKTLIGHTFKYADLLKLESEGWRLRFWETKWNVLNGVKDVYSHLFFVKYS